MCDSESALFGNILSLSTPVLSTTVSSTPVSSTPVLSTPVSSTPVSSTVVSFTQHLTSICFYLQHCY